MSTIHEIVHDITHGDFTNDHLNEILKAVQHRRAQIGREVKRSVQVGATVKFYHPKLGRDLQGAVKAVKIKNITVTTAQGTYRVPANLLEIV